MDKFLEILTNAGIGNNIVLSISLVVIVLPVLGKLWAEAISLRRSVQKDKLEGLFQVIDDDGIKVHPLRVELAFRELFGIRVTASEIKYFLNAASPLSSIIYYKYGREYLTFPEGAVSPTLTKSIRKLWWKHKLSTASLICLAFMLILFLFITITALFADDTADIAMTGSVTIVAIIILSWFCLDNVRAVNAAVHITGGWPISTDGVVIQGSKTSSETSTSSHQALSDNAKSPTSEALISNN